MDKPCNTIEEFNQVFRDYIKKDNLWKKKIEKQIKPLTEERFEMRILQKYGKIVWKIIVGIVGLIGALILIFYYWRKL